MSMLVADCPRCGAKDITFDVAAQLYRFRKHDWQNWYEVFSACRKCSRSTTFLIGLKEYNMREKFYGEGEIVNYNRALNKYFNIDGYVSLRDHVHANPPEHVPEDVKNAFKEGAACLSIGCHNAAATMFRLCVDIATRPLLPDPEDADGPKPNPKQRRDLGLRLPWLFDNGLLPIALKELAQCIREDGNDGAHIGNLLKGDAEDILDFTIVLLERLYTEPKRLELATERRQARRQG